MSIDTDSSGPWLPYSPVSASALARQLHAYWESKRAGPDDLPSRDDIRPEEIRPLLPHIWMMDFDRQGGTFRYRLVGTAVVDGVGRDHTGDDLADCAPQAGSLDVATRALARMMSDGRPIWRRGTPMFHHDTQVMTLENVALPLAPDRRTPNLVLGMTLFFDSQDRIYLPGILRTR